MTTSKLHYSDLYPAATQTMTTDALAQEATLLEDKMDDGSLTRFEQMRYDFIKAELRNR